MKYQSATGLSGSRIHSRSNTFTSPELNYHTKRLGTAPQKSDFETSPRKKCSSRRNGLDLQSSVEGKVRVTTAAPKTVEKLAYRTVDRILGKGSDAKSAKREALSQAFKQSISQWSATFDNLDQTQIRIEDLHKLRDLISHLQGKRYFSEGNSSHKKRKTSSRKRESSLTKSTIHYEDTVPPITIEKGANLIS
jgi:hypothetical protein